MDRTSLTNNKQESQEERVDRLVQLSFDRGTLVLTGTSEADVLRLFPEKIWRYDTRIEGWRCDAIHYPRVREALWKHFGSSFSNNVPEPERVAWPRVHLPELRKEQIAAVDAWEKHGRRGQIVMPTGTGKTVVALAAMARTQVSTLVVCPIRDLMYQWHNRIEKVLGYDAGIMGDNLFGLRPVTVTTYDSAYLHMPDIGAKFGLVIFDEEHHLPGPLRREAALYCASEMRLGLSATPERSDGLEKDLDWLVGPELFHQTLPEARGIILAEYDVKRIPVVLTPEEQSRYHEANQTVRVFIRHRRRANPMYGWRDLCRESARDPEAREVQKAYYLKRSIEDRATEKLRVLEDLFRLHVGQRIIVFAGSNAMAMEVSRRFLVPTLLEHSRKRERQRVLEGFSKGEFPVIVANQVLDEGVDVPEAKVAVVIGGQASTRQAKQRLGRILRRVGSARAVLYEVVCRDTREVERSQKRRRSDAFVT